MINQKRILVFTACYNEKENIKKLILKIRENLPEGEILIIDDNSPDQTKEVINDLKDKISKLYLIVREKKLGLDTAHKFAYEYAIKNNYDYLITMDADLSHDPKDVPRLLKNLNHYDLVIGSRYVDGVSVVNWPIRRLMLSYGANLYSRIITGMPINDGTGGFKAWKTSLLEKISLSEVQSQGYSFQIEMNFRSWILGATIKEESIIFFDRTIGSSKMSKSIVYEAIFMVWKLRIWKTLGII